MHEFVHALGFWHEHQRPDRNEHVKILEQNIRKNKLPNFYQQHDTNTFGLPYDAGSIMHYRDNAFGKEDAFGNERQTIQLIINPKRGDIEMGQRQDLSELDILKISKMYDCGNRFGKDCWKKCGSKSGPCNNFCGSGNYCCRQGTKWINGGCDGKVGGATHHECSPNPTG